MAHCSGITLGGVQGIMMDGVLGIKLVDYMQDQYLTLYIITPT